MGCNCKNKFEKINEKYGDGEKTVKKDNIFIKIIEFILQMLFGILCGAIIIVMIVPMLLYIIIRMMFGKETTIKMKNITKYLNKEQN